MTTENEGNPLPERPKMPSKAELAASARALVRAAQKGYLATLRAGSGHPYASLVTVATAPDGTPLMLISRLAIHTQNLMADPRASLLIDATSNTGDPLAGGRVTLIGRARTIVDGSARRRFLARHPEAEMYAGFTDFAFWQLDVEGAHYVGGFGRIVDLSASEMLTEVADASALVGAEEDIVAHMNEDHLETASLYATKLGGEAPGPWRTSGVDPEGLDLVADGETCRIPFSGRLTTPAALRQELVRLAAQARAKS